MCRYHYELITNTLDVSRASTKQFKAEAMDQGRYEYVNVGPGEAELPEAIRVSAGTSITGTMRGSTYYMLINIPNSGLPPLVNGYLSGQFKFRCRALNISFTSRLLAV